MLLDVGIDTSQCSIFHTGLSAVHPASFLNPSARTKDACVSCTRTASSTSLLVFVTSFTCQHAQPKTVSPTIEGMNVGEFTGPPAEQGD